MKKHITIKRSNGTVALEGNYTDHVTALEDLAKTEHGTFKVYRTCLFDGHLVYVGEFCI